MMDIIIRPFNSQHKTLSDEEMINIKDKIRSGKIYNEGTYIWQTSDPRSIKAKLLLEPDFSKLDLYEQYQQLQGVIDVINNMKEVISGGRDGFYINATNIIVEDVVEFLNKKLEDSGFSFTDIHFTINKSGSGKYNNLGIYVSADTKSYEIPSVATEVSKFRKSSIYSILGIENRSGRILTVKEALDFMELREERPDYFLPLIENIIDKIDECVENNRVTDNRLYDVAMNMLIEDIVKYLNNRTDKFNTSSKYIIFSYKFIKSESILVFRSKIRGSFPSMLGNRLSKAVKEFDNSVILKIMRYKKTSLSLTERQANRFMRIREENPEYFLPVISEITECLDEIESNHD